MANEMLTRAFRAAIASAMAERDPLVREVLLASLESSVEDDDELAAIFNTMVDRHGVQVVAARHPAPAPTGDWQFNGHAYSSRNAMYAARRAEYRRLIEEDGFNSAQAARTVGVSKRTGTAWRHGWSHGGTPYFPDIVPGPGAATAERPQSP